MRIVAMCNAGQYPMMRNMLNSAEKAGLPMDLFHCYVVKEQKEVATYNTTEFHTITLKKLEVILQNLTLDEEVLWVDNDIVFFTNPLADLQSKEGSIVFQDDGWSPCSGFFLARSNKPLVKDLFYNAIRLLKTDQNKMANDQHAIAHLLKCPELKDLHYILLDREEYPNGDIYFNQSKTQKARIVHNNYLYTTKEKEQRFKDHTLWSDAFDIKKINLHFV